jgi:hypothetical protein
MSQLQRITNTLNRTEERMECCNQEIEKLILAPTQNEGTGEETQAISTLQM